MGVSDALRPHGVTIQALEPAGSATLTGGQPGAFAMQGWAGFKVPQWDPGNVDHVDAIADDEALKMMLRLSREEGISPASRPEPMWAGRTDSPNGSDPMPSSSRRPSTPPSST
jgi:cysteine synthase